MKRTILNLVMVSGAVLAVPYPTDLSAQSPEEFGRTINVAGRQRMLSQRAAKEYIAARIPALKDQSSKDLAETIKLFESSLKNLQGGQDGLVKPPANITKQLGNVEAAWKKYHGMLKDPKADLDALVVESENVLKLMNKGVKAYEVASVKAGIKGKGKVINVAGRQRMLSQKMTKEALLVAIGHGGDKYSKACKKTSTLFQSSLDALINGSKKMRIEAASTPKAKAQLAKVKEIWEGKMSGLIEKAAQKTIKAGDGPALYAVSKDTLKAMHAAVGLLEKGE